MLLSFLLLLLNLNFSNPDTFFLKVTVEDIRIDKGVLNISIYRPSDEFLGDDPYKNFKFKPRIPSRTVEIILPTGRYAIVAFHDEDSDEEMDYNFIGIPQEGYGFSRDAADGLSKPPFEDAEILLDQEKSLIIDLVHW